MRSTAVPCVLVPSGVRVQGAGLGFAVALLGCLIATVVSKSQDVRLRVGDLT